MYKPVDGGETMYPAPYYYRRRFSRRGARRKQGLALFLLVLFLFVGGYHLIRFVNVGATAQKLSHYILGDKGQYALNLMCSAMPLLNHSQAAGSYSSIPLTNLLVHKFFAALGLDRPNPLALLEKELPALAIKETTAVPAIKKKAPPPPSVPGRQEAKEPKLSKDCLVAIYNTHTGETYALTDGVERLQGKRGGVVQAAAALEEVLEKKFGVRVARSDAIHDDVYSYSYAKSKETLERLLDENPNIMAVFDIHRDAGKPREESIVDINGEIVAPVLIIVGSDARAPFPGWRKNYEFAKKLAAEIDKKYPGLCLGVRVKDGRYNQFLHPRALLLEIGSVSNSTGEAVRSAQLLGEVLGPMVLELWGEEQKE